MPAGIVEDIGKLRSTPMLASTTSECYSDAVLFHSFSHSSDGFGRAEAAGLDRA